MNAYNGIQLSLNTHRLQPTQEMTEEEALLIDIGEQSAIPASVWTDLLTAKRRGMGVVAVAHHFFFIRATSTALGTAGCPIPFPLP